MRVTAGTNKFMVINGSRATLILTFFGAWELLVSSKILDEFFIPRPSSVIQRIIQIATSGQYLDQMLITLSTFSLGLLVGSLLGLLMGFVIGGVKYLRNFMMVYVLLVAATPKVLFYPIIIKIFVQPFYFKIAFVALHAFIFVTIAVVSALRNMNPEILNMCKTYGCSTPLKVYRKIFWPYAFFSFLAGLRMATISSFVGAVVADMLIAPGVGYTVRLLAYNFKVVDVYAVIILVALFAITINFVLLRVEGAAGKRLRLELEQASQ